MSNFFTGKQIKSMLTGVYICDKCGGKMYFEDESESVLICDKCGYDVELDYYGRDPDDDPFPSEDDI